MSDANDNIVNYSGRSVRQHTITNVPIFGGEQPYVQPRQTGTGQTRGTQTIAGYLAITDPTTGKTIAVLGYKPGAF